MEAQIITTLAHAFSEGPQDAVAFGLAEPDEVHIVDLFSDDPASELLGFTAPRAWSAFGVSVPGRARAFPPEPASVGVVVTPDEIHLVHLVDRSGDVATVLRRMADPPEVLSPSEAPEGRIPDACRRALGLPTPPPQVPLAVLRTLLWLDAVFTSAQANPAGWLDWPAVASLRPGPAARGLVSWEAARLSCAGGTLAVPGLSPHHAAWMDEGMFSRWACGAFPAPELMLDVLDVLLPVGVARRLREAAA